MIVLLWFQVEPGKKSHECLVIIWYLVQQENSFYSVGFKFHFHVLILRIL